MHIGDLLKDVVYPSPRPPVPPLTSFTADELRQIIFLTTNFHLLILIVLGTFHPITEDDSRLGQPDTTHSLTWQEGSETPRSVSSSNTKNHNNSDLTNYNSRRKQISVTPMIVRKFSFQ